MGKKRFSFRHERRDKTNPYRGMGHCLFISPAEIAFMVYIWNHIFEITYRRRRKKDMPPTPTTKNQVVGKAYVNSKIFKK